MRTTPAPAVEGQGPDGNTEAAHGGNVYTDPALAFHDVGLTFENGTHALDGIHIAIRPGEFVSLVGSSGCGKSTLLRLAAGFEKPTTGTVSVASAKVGYVFQEATLLP
ncbi:Monosaccharide-transporting ATPase [Nocardia seriolae]|nr:Monosaccharide-transporting ATPase [Nocardia seriolae]BEK89228.1 hypothetical protein NSERKGN1266_51790 [Nocardia seriolae]BEK96755.1 hypothetical protein NSER024013_46610 [Nocardia seriolae]GEM26361.1 hypothetical protein NS2_46000 [Nocardia seriolae NBRC 15557]